MSSTYTALYIFWCDWFLCHFVFLQWIEWQQKRPLQHQAGQCLLQIVLLFCLGEIIITWMYTKLQIDLWGLFQFIPALIMSFKIFPPLQVHWGFSPLVLQQPNDTRGVQKLRWQKMLLCYVMRCKTISLIFFALTFFSPGTD